MNYTHLYPVARCQYSYYCIRWHRGNNGQVYDQFHYPIYDGETVLSFDFYTTEQLT